MYQTTDMQKGMIFHSLMNDSGEYCVLLDIRLKGNLNVEVLEKSFNIMIENYDVFRTLFIYKKTETPLQVVLKERKGTIYFEDLSDLEESTKSLKMKTYWEGNKGFDLQKDLLMKIGIFKLSEDEYSLQLYFHHIILDGWCMGIFLGEFFDTYTKLKNGIAIKPVPKFQYKTYMSWLKAQDMDEAKKYWEEYIEDYNNVLNFPMKYNTQNSMYKQNAAYVEIKGEAFQNLIHIAQNNYLTLNTVLQSAWGIVLQKYFNMNDVVFGTVTSGRNIPLDGIEKALGLFINTLPTRIKTEEDDTILSLMKKVQERSNAGRDYEYYSLVDIQEKTAVGNELINHIMAFENYPFEQKKTDEDSDFVITGFHGQEKTNYHLNIKAVMLEGMLQIEFLYNEFVFEEKTIMRLKGFLEKILNEISNDSSKKIRKIEMIEKEEKQKILNEFNCTNSVILDNEDTVQKYVQRTLQMGGNKTAIYCKDAEISYAELDEKTTQIGRVLRDKGIKRNDVVGIVMNRGVEVALGILGVLKAGGAYLPIDATLPKDRINFLLKDSKASIVLSQKNILKNFEFDGEVLALDVPETYNQASLDLLENLNEPEDSAYVIYTSGTTGTPKGVVLKNIALVNITKDLVTKMDLKKGGVLSTASISFDMFSMEFFMSLGLLGEFVIADHEERMDNLHLSRLIEQRNVKVMWMTPSRVATFLYDEKNRNTLNKLQRICLGGEALKENVLEELWEQTDAKIFNFYGPTEITVYCTAKEMKPGEKEITIGSPISNSEIYIVGNDGNLCPIGVPGEILVGGIGLAKEYLNREDLTQEKFVANPYKKGEKVYKTGDLGCWTSAGEIKYIGRIDEQIKIRGNRVEIGEIEESLKKIEGIRDCVVLVLDKDNGEKVLSAYIVGEEEDQVFIKNELSKELPSYMIPSHITNVESIPITVNGKVDKKELQKVNIEMRNLEHEEPINQLQKQIKMVWEKILGQERIGINQSFFDIGGSSITAMKLSSKLGEVFKKEVSVKDIFVYETIAKQEEFLEKMGEKRRERKIKPIGEKAYYKTSSAEKRMYLLQQYGTNNKAYNTMVAFDIYGNLDSEELEYKLNLLIERHQNLKSQYEIQNEELMKCINQSVRIKLKKYEMNEEEILDYKDKIIEAFDLTNPPLIKAVLIKVENEKHVLVLNFHHIVVDGLSMKILVDDFLALYKGDTLNINPLRYVDYAHWEHEWKLSSEKEKEEKYWLNMLNDEVEKLQIRTDYERPQIKQFKGKMLQFPIETSTVNDLKKICKQEKTTMYMLMLSMYKLLLSKYSGKEDVLIGTVASGRKAEELENIVGMFVNTLPLRSKVSGEKQFKDYLQEIKKLCVESFVHQMYPFDELIKKLNVEIDSSSNPLFDYLFVYQNSEKSLLNEKIKDIEIKSSNLNLVPDISKFDISLEVFEEENGMQCFVNYDVDLFKESTIRMFMNHFNYLLKSIAFNINKKIKDIQLVDTEEKRKLLSHISSGRAENVKAEDVLQERIKHYGIANSKDKALVFKGKSINYEQLNKKTNQLAHLLRKSGVGRNKIVAIVMERGLEVPLAMIGVLKAGGAYLPIDVDLPRERIEYMLRDSGACVVLTQSRVKNNFHFAGEVLELDGESVYAKESEEDVSSVNEIEDLAYIIYTSGTTGEPKGVMLTNKSLTNLLKDSIQRFQFSTEEVGIALSSISFDMFSSELFILLYNKGTVIITDNEERLDVINIIELMKRYAVTSILTTPSRISTALHLFQNSGVLKNMKRIMFGGESLPSDLVEKLQRDYSMCIFNLYGPSEATMHCTSKKIIDRDNITIGRPINNTEIYILNHDLQLVPVGVVGEICIGGFGIAQGYLQKEELTNEKFVENPYVNGEKIYKTGDVGYWNESGEIVYLGRNDEQIKIRGYRVEPEEIQEKLNNMPEVKDSVVLACKEDSGETYLVAYVVTDVSNMNNIRGALEHLVPNYMVPKYFTKVDNIPITINGKIDKKKLGSLKVEKLERKNLKQPENLRQQVLVDIIKSVLTVDEISLDDHFLYIGGDSFKAIDIIAKLRKEGLTVGVGKFLSSSTIEEISFELKEMEDVNTEEIIADTKLSPMHKKVMEHNDEKAINSFTQAILLVNHDGFVEDIVQTNFENILKHHDILRANYVRKGEMTQVIRGMKERNDIYKLHVYQLHEEELEEKQIEKIYSELKADIAVDKHLIKLAIFKGAKKDYLLFIIHHFLMDTVSWMIILEDFIDGYSKLINNQAADLGRKSSPYSKWIEAIYEYGNSQEILGSYQHWEQIEKEFKDDEIRFRNMGNMKLLTREFTKEETMAIKKVQQLYSVKFENILLAAFGTRLKEIEGKERILIEKESHGRNLDFDGVNLSNTIGWFTSPYPFVIDVSNEDIVENMKSVNKDSEQVPRYGRDYSILRYIREAKDYQFKLEPKYVFNHLGEVKNKLYEDHKLSLANIELDNNPSDNYKVNYSIYTFSRIDNDMLRINIQYNTAEYDDSAMEEFISSYQEGILNITNGCLV